MIMEDLKRDKISRILGMYTELIHGNTLNKAKEAIRYNVNERSIQRDIDDIRSYLENTASETGYTNSVIYDRFTKGYRLERIYEEKLTNPEVLAICKILLESRAFRKEEIQELLEKLITNCIPLENQKIIGDLVRNESFHYIEPRHHVEYLQKMWDIGKAIYENRYIEIKYQGIQGSTVKTRKLKPLAIMFSDYYFYLTAFIEDGRVRENFNVIDDSFPTIYRIDRIQAYKILDEKYYIPYANRFEEGEFRKRVQFMYGGKLRKVRFKYTGYSVEAVLDRLPTAKVEGVEDGGYIITAEVFGDGIDMWLRSQGKSVNIIE